MPQLTLLHTADLHLGSVFSSTLRCATQRKQDLQQTFLKIIDLCHTQAVDLLLIAGDLFEHWNIPDSLLALVRDSFATIKHTTIVIAAGNHDPCSALSPYSNATLWSPNVHILPTTFGSLVLPHLEAEIWGASFANTYEPNPLFGQITPKQPHYLQIGVQHGTLGGSGTSSVYNPILLPGIEQSGLDYLALGHIHKASSVEQIGNTYYAYPGSPEGHGFDELGTHGVYIGTLTKQHCNLTYTPTCQREYREVAVDITGCSTTYMAAQAIHNALAATHGADYAKHLYKLFIKGKLPEQHMVDFAQLPPLLDSLFFVKSYDHTALEIDYGQLAQEVSLKGIFTAHMLEQLDHSPTPVGELALQLGLKAFQGEVLYYED